MGPKFWGENQDLKRWEWGRILSCKELNTTLIPIFKKVDKPRMITSISLNDIYPSIQFPLRSLQCCTTYI